MPELPEVETVRKVLESRLLGARLEAAQAAAVTFWRAPDAARIRAAAVGRRLERVERTGKYLVLGFEGGTELVLHLMMSGRLVIGGGAPATRFTFRFQPDSGAPVTVSFSDRRRLGSVTLSRPVLGPDPTAADFRPEHLRALLKARRAPIKAVLMDQKTLAGVGNIYATEALSGAGIRPTRRAGGLTLEETGRLYAALRRTLELGVRLGGATLKDKGYSDPLGRSGRMQERLNVYGLSSCGRCRGALKLSRRRLAGRSTWFCPRCQK